MREAARAFGVATSPWPLLGYFGKVAQLTIVAALAQGRTCFSVAFERRFQTASPALSRFPRVPPEPWCRRSPAYSKSITASTANAP